MARVKRKQANDQDRQDEQYKDMQLTIQRNETVIDMLKLQLSQFQARKSSCDTAVCMKSGKLMSIVLQFTIPSIFLLFRKHIFS